MTQPTDTPVGGPDSLHPVGSGTPRSDGEELEPVTGDVPPVTGSFGAAAAEMANETEVEATDELTAYDLAQANAIVAKAQTDISALTGDLKRLQAEYLNYKRRVERDRDLIRQNATYAALAPITEVLDTIDRAREHGPLEVGLKTVADQLERVVAARGLEKFGAVGDAFDPTQHEALSHIGQDPDVSVTTCKVIAKAGYRLGDRVVRAAQVLVVDPVTEPAEPATSSGTDGEAAEAEDRAEA